MIPKTNKWRIKKDFLIQEYIEKRKSLLKIAKETGIPYETLFWYKKRFKIPSYPLSFWMKGKRNSPKTEFKKGILPWNKGTTGLTKAWNKGRKLSEEEKKKISLVTKKAMNQEKVREKIKKTQFTKGVIPWNKGKTNVYSEETRENIKKARLKQIFPKKNTNAEVALFGILKELQVKFNKHVPIKNICQVDVFVEPNIILLADGDYWHCNPKFYPKPKTEAQVKNIERDHKADDKLLKENYIVKRFWEFDLLNDREKCKEIIKKLIKGE